LREQRIIAFGLLIDHGLERGGLFDRDRLRAASLSLATFHTVATGSYFINMRAVGIKVLKNKLSEYVRLAEHGETILVTDRDRVVAEIVPPETSRSPVLADALLAEAVRQGWITPPALPSRGCHHAIR
jgi:antitoxin (DNA-binding transcriptional repressor) of toxin-antitoxin stability system